MSMTTTDILKKLVAKLEELGVDRVFMDTSGNALRIRLETQDPQTEIVVYNDQIRINKTYREYVE